MVNKTLVDYISAQLKSNVNKEFIKSSLLAKGWQEQDIDDSYKTIFSPSSQPDTTSKASSNQASMSSSSKELTGAGTIFDQALRLYKSRFKTLVGILSLAIVSIIVLIAIFIGISYLMPDDLSLAGLWALLLSLIFNLILVFIITWTLAALLCAVKDHEAGIGIRESFGHGLKKIFSVGWVIFLLSLITNGGSLLILVPGILLVVWLQSIWGFVALIVFSLLMIVFLVAFIVWFSFALFILVTEDVKGMNALLKSKTYIKKHWFSVFWRYLFLQSLVVGLLLYIMIPVSTAIQYLSILVMFATSSFLAWILGIVILLIFLAILVLVPPIYLCYVFLVYNKIKTEKGQFEFIPKVGAKVGYILLGVLGNAVIIGLLITLMLTSLNNARGMANDAMRKSDVNQMRNVMEMYYDDHRSYPTSLDQAFDDSSKMPTDPTTKQPYTYQSLDGGQKYEICATLGTGEPYCADSSGWTSGSDSFFDDTDYDFDDFDFENFPLEEMNILEKARDALLPI